jgi:L-arabonate dehydrase
MGSTLPKNKVLRTGRGGLCRIRVSLREKRLDVALSDAEIAARLAAFVRPATPRRGYAKLYAEHILGPERGCDFDFLTVGGQG